MGGTTVLFSKKLPGDAEVANRLNMFEEQGFRGCEEIKNEDKSKLKGIFPSAYRDECLSSQSPNYPAGLGSYPCTKRQVNIASDLTALLSPHPPPQGVNLLCAREGCDKMRTHLIEKICDITP